MSKGFKKHKLALALSACMMVGPSLVHALGMGEIEVGTSLNEPLGAKIKLFSATAEELSNLTVRLASQQAFNRMGIERLPVLRDLEFELVNSGSGAPYIEVKSSKAIKEPFLDFILTVNWSSGQMMREYTLLLDPPVFEKDQQVGRISAATTEPAAVVRETPAAATPRQRVTAPVGSYGPTSRKDTLWTVAQDLRSDRSVSVPQMMIGLLKENPEAFENNNINNLKAGYILRAPEMEVITELSKQQAANETNRQYQEWLAAKGKATTSTGRQQRVAAAPATGTEGAGPSPTTAPTVSKQEGEDARLQLLTPDEEAKIRAGVGSGTSGESIEALQQQLAVAVESAEVSRQENSDLRMRLEELEKQLQSVQKLLTLKDDTLGALQAEVQQAPPEEVAVPVEEEEAPAETGVEKIEPKVAEKPAKPAAQPEPVETSLVDEILGNQTYLYAAGGGFIMLLLLAAIIMRRRRSDDDDDFTVVAPVVNANPVEKSQGDDQGSAVATTAVAAATAAVAAEAEAVEAEDEVIADDFGDGFGTIQAEESEIDPIAEADVYLAYRRYEQAEALLKEAINTDPDRNELKLKLLEIYHATKDANSFEAQAESLYAALGGQDNASWSQAVEMGRELLPDHPLFGESVVATDAAETIVADDAGEFNFDDEQPLSEDTTDLSDDDLADSLGFSGADESVTDAIADSVDAVMPDGDNTDISLDDLGDLDLDLDLGSTDDLDLSGGDAGENLADELQEIEMNDESTAEEAYDLDVELADSLGDDELDLSAELESIVADETSGDIDTVLDNVDEAELGDVDIAAELGDLDMEAAESQSKRVEADLDIEPDSVALELEPAQSEFESRDVVSEEDVLAESLAQDEVSADIDLDLPLDLDADTSQLHAADELEAVVNGDSTEPENIDSLADMTNLGDLDFSDMSDENNDDIFDNADDMVGTKLDLAKAYIDMGDQDGARSILGEVVQEGDDDQRQEAEQLMQQIS